MTCEQTQAQLNALADGALPPVQAWRMRRHLAQCRDCAQVFAEIVQMGAEARAWRDSAPPAALQSRIALALPPQTARLENTAMILERPLPIADPPHRFRTRKVRVALALAACLASVLTLALWPNKQTNLPAAYADTVLAMQRVRTAAWTKTDTVYKADGSIEYHLVAQTWVRRDPPAIAYLVPPDPKAPDIGGGYRELLDAQGLHRTNLDDGQTGLGPLRKPIAEEVRDKLSGLTVNNAAKGLPVKNVGSTILTHQTPWTQERTALSGHTLLRFRKDMTVIFPSLPGPAMKGPIVIHYTLWVEPETHRLQREEWQYTLPKFGGVTSVLDHFVYDQPAPAGVFDDATYSAASLHVPMAAPSLQGHSHPIATRKP